jgi:streptogramin lyase
VRSRDLDVKLNRLPFTIRSAMDPARTFTRALTGWLALITVAAAVLLTPAIGRGATVQTHPVPQPAAGLNSLVLGPDGNLWFGESNAADGSYHVGSISPSGQFGKTIDVPVNQFDTNHTDGPDLLTSSGDSLWFRADLDQIYRYGSGQLTNVLGGPDFITSDFTTSIGPSDEGGIWATDWDGTDQPGGQTDLRRYPVDAGLGAVPTYFPATYSATWFSTPLAMGGSGAIWYSDDGNDLWLTEDGGVSQSYPITGLPLGAPNAIAFDGEGNLWFTSEYPGSPFTSPDDGAIGSLRTETTSAAATALPEHDVPTSIAESTVDGKMYFGWYVASSTTGPHGGIGQIDPGTGKITLADLGGYQPASVAFTPDGALWFVNADRNQVDRVSISQLFPPATPTPTPPTPTPKPRPKPKAPKLSLTAPIQRLAAVRSQRQLIASCALSGAGRCTVRATIAAQTAKHLKLMLASNRAKAYTLGTAAMTFKKKGKVRLALKLSARTATALKQARTLKVTLTAASSAAQHSARTVTRTITLR